MKHQVWKLLLVSLLAVPAVCFAGRFAGQDRHEAEVKLQASTFQDVLNQLFGTSTAGGLLNGNGPFEFRAENVMLTTQQVQDFFAPATPGSKDLAALVAAVEKIPGAEVRIEGFANGTPFELKIEGAEVKLEGLVLTQTQFNSLVSELQVAGLREGKIEAVVNGHGVEVKLENGMRQIERVDDRHRHERRDRDEEQAEHEDHGDRDHRDRDRHDIAKAARLDGTVTERMGRPEKAERVERMERVEKIERIERPERPERPEHPERPERPGHH